MRNLCWAVHFSASGHDQWRHCHIRPMYFLIYMDRIWQWRHWSWPEAEKWTAQHKFLIDYDAKRIRSIFLTSFEKKYKTVRHLKNIHLSLFTLKKLRLKQGPLLRYKLYLIVFTIKKSYFITIQNGPFCIKVQLWRVNIFISTILSARSTTLVKLGPFHAEYRSWLQSVGNHKSADWRRVSRFVLSSSSF